MRPFMRFLACAACVLLALIACDAVWLGLSFKPLYQPRMGDLLSATPRFGAAAAFYLLYAAALTRLVIWPVLARAAIDWTHLILNAGLFGLAAYGTYDLTALAVIRNWPLDLSLIDMGWGMVISATACCAGTLTIRRLKL